MRLAVFTNQFPSLVSTFFARDMRALIEAGIEIDIFPLYPVDHRLWCYVPDILSPEVLPRNRVHHVSLRSHLQQRIGSLPAPLPRFLGDASTVALSAWRFGPGPLAKSAYASLKGWIWANRRTNDYDHVLAYWGSYAATSAFVFHRLTNPSAPFSMFLHAGPDLYRGRVYMHQKLLYADNIIVVCEFNRRFIQQSYGSIFDQIGGKIFVHHPGIDLSDYAFLENGRSPHRVIGVGRLNPLKGFDYLIRAVGVLRRRGREVELDLVGGGEEGARLRRLAKHLDISDRVRFLGWRSAEEARASIREASILAHPSIGLGDAVPTVIKESMAVGTPVVASHVAGIPELLDDGKCGVLVPPRDVDALANALEMLLSDPAACRRYAVAGRRFAEKTFDLWRNGERLAELLLRSRRGILQTEDLSRDAARA